MLDGEVDALREKKTASPTREHFRGVLWRRDPVSVPEGELHRYTVVGMLVTDRPLRVCSDETAIDGTVTGVAEALEGARHVRPRDLLGDANSVLMSLDTSWPHLPPVG